MIKTTNPCNRCGKQRVVVRSYQEVVGSTTVTRTESVCPDPDCQKKVDKTNSAEKEKRLNASYTSQNKRFTYSNKPTTKPVA